MELVRVIAYTKEPDRTTDSAFVKDGKFTIVGTMPEGPRYYWMIFKKSRFKNSFALIKLFIDNNDKITIKCKEDMKTLHAEEVERYVQGSPSNGWLLAIAGRRPGNIG